MSAWTFIQQPPKVKLYANARVSSRVPFLYLKKNKQPNLPFLSGRLTSSSVLGPSRSSLVQRSFFCGDVIAITSWAPDVVNLVRPNIILADFNLAVSTPTAKPPNLNPRQIFRLYGI